MTLIKRSDNLFPSFPSFFDDFLTRDLFDWPKLSVGTSVPAVNIKENENGYEVEVAAPGLSKDDFHVELDNNVLTISSEKEIKNEEKDKEGNYTRQEFSYSTFRRSFTLPNDVVDIEKIDAKYKDGVLRLSLPKREEAKPKPIKTIKIS